MAEATQEMIALAREVWPVNEIGERMIVAVPRPVDLVITDAAMRAACDLIGNDVYGRPVWTVETISPENRVVQAFARFEREIRAAAHLKEQSA